MTTPLILSLTKVSLFVSQTFFFFIFMFLTLYQFLSMHKGTMDALMCDRGDVWSPDEELIRTVKEEVDEVVRWVLKIAIMPSLVQCFRDALLVQNGHCTK